MAAATWDDSADERSSNVRDRRSSAPGGTPRDRRQSVAVLSESLWTVGDVAAYLRASRSWVYHQAECGRLPSLRIGGLLRFSPIAVRKYAFALTNEQP